MGTPSAGGNGALGSAMWAAGVTVPALLRQPQQRRVALVHECDGLFQADRKKLYAPVKKGDALGRLLSTARFEDQPVTAPVAGYVLKLGAARKNCDVALPPQHPFVDRGEAVAVLWSAK